MAIMYSASEFLVRISSLQVNRFTQDPIGVGYSVLKEQADAGAPVNVQEICRTLLPPGLWEPMRMIDQQRSKLAEGLHAIKAALPTDKIDHLLLRMPWQREKSWLEGLQSKLPAPPQLPGLPAFFQFSRGA